MISFVLGNNINTSNAVMKNKKEDLFVDMVKSKLTLLLSFFYSLYQRILNEIAYIDIKTDKVDTISLGEAYNSIVYLVTGRLLQSNQLRHLVKDFLLSLPEIPSVTLNLLQVLMYTGTKPSAAPAISTGTAGRPSRDLANKLKFKGTRIESLNILSQIVLSTMSGHQENIIVDGKMIDNSLVSGVTGLSTFPSILLRNQEKAFEAGNIALNHLLWCAISSDFELRSRAISTIVR